MMMDREETEDEVYMPTDKVFGLSQSIIFWSLNILMSSPGYSPKTGRV